MPLTHCILHKLERPVPGADIVIKLRDEDNSCTDGTFSLFEQLKHSMMRSSQKEYGHFDSQKSDLLLPGLLRDQQQGGSSFTSLTQAITKQLKLVLDNFDDAFSAQLLFAIERVMEQNFFYILWFDHVEACHINNQQEVEFCQYIDTNKVPYALKVHLNDWLDEESPKYLTLLSARGNKTLSEAFTEVSGFSTGIDLVEETKQFLDIVDQYAETLPEEKVRETKSKILDYCVDQDRIGAPVVFEDLSQQVNEQAPNEFSQFVAEKQPQPKTEFHTDRASLKRYIRFFGRDKDMSISFSSDLFGEDIEYNEHTGTLVIKKIPKSLRQQLSRYRSED
jgi:nucleoid-associated protein